MSSSHVAKTRDVITMYVNVRKDSKWRRAVQFVKVSFNAFAKFIVAQSIPALLFVEKLKTAERTGKTVIMLLSRM